MPSLYLVCLLVVLALVGGAYRLSRPRPPRRVDPDADAGLPRVRLVPPRDAGVDDPPAGPVDPAVETELAQWVGTLDRAERWKQVAKKQLQ